MGVELKCERLREVRKRWLEVTGLPASVHVPYGLDAESHVSLAYIHSKHAEEAQRLTEELRRKRPRVKKEEVSTTTPGGVRVSEILVGSGLDWSKYQKIPWMCRPNSDL